MLNNANSDVNFVPLKRGHIFSMAPIGPLRVYWPRVNSISNRGMPHRNNIKK